jgi:HTH-type transcriptional regulator / antitoxin HigA
MTMSLDTRNVAAAFPPGEFIKEELEARGWSQEDFAEIMGRQSSIISGLVNGKRAVSPDIASDLASAFGTTAQFWMNLETAYQLFEEGRPDQTVARKARLFAKAPIKEMIKRGWIEASKDLDVLENRVLKFLEISSLDQEPKLSYAAKKSTPTANPSQVAWVCRAKKIARGVHAAKFSSKSFADALAKLKELQANPEDVRHIPKVLAEGGVRFLLIESLPKGKIDGACFWLDAVSPVIAIAMRYDRIDHLWYLTGHECGHVENRDALGGQPILDVDLVGDQAIPFEDKTEIEKRADLFAESFLVDKREMNNFIARVRPLYSKQKIKNFAARVGVHPAIVLGQLQHRKEIDWSHSREMLVKVRDMLIPSALTDGWGYILSTRN